MNSEAIVRIVREGLVLVMLLSAPALFASVLVGFVVSVFQATTQIQEQTLSYVPKLVAVFLTLAIAGPWILMQTVRFTRVLFDSIAMVR